MRRCALLSVLVMVAIALAPSQAQAGSNCLQVRNYEFEVCLAYYVNDTLASRVPYYKYGSSFNPFLKEASIKRMRSRYRGAARSYLERQVESWPLGKNKVSFPVIRIRSVWSNLRSGSATLRTEETWLVRSAVNSSVLFREVRKRHLIRLRRVSDTRIGVFFRGKTHFIRKWVVTQID